MDAQEMIEILEEIIRDPETNATARCTAIRTLREVQNGLPAQGGNAFDELDEFGKIVGEVKRLRAVEPPAWELRYVP
jgi:hypothetical protein